MSIVRELKRRNVFRVAIAYVIIAWLLLQVSDTLVPALHLPEWFHSGVALLLLLGFPVVLLFAWAFEMTPEGLKREHEVDRSQSITHVTGRKLDFMIIGVLVLALGYFAYDKFVLSGGREQAATGEVATESDNSIAVLPFANLSADQENAFFASGVHEDILTSLAKIRSLKIRSGPH